MRKLQRDGFTIVELMIVIVVMAILAAITVVTYSNIQERAQNSARQSAARQALSVLQLYKADKGGLPEIPAHSYHSSAVRAHCIGEGWPQAANGQSVCWNIMDDGSISGSTFYSWREVNEALVAYGTLPQWPQQAAGGGETGVHNALVLHWRPNDTEIWPGGYALGWIQPPGTDCNVSGAEESGGSTFRRCVVPLGE